MSTHQKSFKGRLRADSGFKIFVLAISCICAIPLLLILYFIIQKGITSINWDFLVNDEKPVGESGGGIAHAIIGSVLLVAIASVIAIPIAIITGVYIAENKKNKIAQFARFSAEILQGVPSIVIGIIGFTWIVLPMGHHYSLISGSIALAIMMMPFIIRATEETISLIPGTIKEAALALGVPYYKTILRIVIPSGFSGIISGIIISVARVAGETAPLLFTAFGNHHISIDPTQEVESLPHLIFDYARDPNPMWTKMAWGASFVLIMWILIINILAKILTRRWKIQF